MMDARFMLKCAKDVDEGILYMHFLASQFTPMAWSSCTNVSYLVFYIRLRAEQPWGRRRLDRLDKFFFIEFIEPDLVSRERWN